MDPGLDFAQALLDQLRRDLKRFAPGCAVELERALGRRPRYLRRVAAKNLRLDEAFAAMRFLGFLPTEYLNRLTRSKEWIPRGIPGFFRRRRPSGPKRYALRELDAFISWGRTVLIDEPAPAYRFDIMAQLEPLGLDVGALDILNGADSLFSILARHRPEILSLDAARGLSRSLDTISNALLSQGHLTECCETLDLGFRLEHRLDDLKTRHALFRTGARLSRELGFHFDALWCCNEAIFLGLLVPELGAVTEDREWLDTFEETAGARGPALDFLEAGKNDSVAVLAAMESDRAVSGWSAADLDRQLGAKNAFSGTRNRGEPMTVTRWGRLLEALSIFPTTVIRRSQIDSIPLRSGQFFQGLKEPGHPRPRHSPQERLLNWSKMVSVVAKAPEIGFPDVPVSESPIRAFSKIYQAIQELSNQLPDRLSYQEAEMICRELVRAAYMLRIRGDLNGAADLLDVAFGLLASLEPGPLLPLSYRNGAYLALYLGRPREAMGLVMRAIRFEVNHHERVDASLSLFAGGVIAGVMADFDSASRFHKACWDIPLRRIDDHSLAQATAVSCLRAGSLDEAGRWLTLINPEVEPPTDLEKGELLAVRAEYLSTRGQFDEAEKLFVQALELLKEQENITPIAVVSVNRISHLLDHRQVASAIAETTKLIALSDRITSNPIGRVALEELARNLARRDYDSLRKNRLLHVERSLRFPNAAKSLADE